MDQETKQQFEHLAEITKKGFDDVDKRFEQVDKRFDKIEGEMVTKEYLDEKLADLRGDMVVLMRKGDRKLTHLVKILKNKQVLDQEEAEELLTMEPFPHFES